VDFERLICFLSWKILKCYFYVRYQLHAAISQVENTELLGLKPGSPLVTNLKQRVVSLASNVGVINTVQMAAQNALQSGWSILLPTAEERARALSSLLSSGGKDISMKFFSRHKIFVYVYCNRFYPWN